MALLFDSHFTTTVFQLDISVKEERRRLRRAVLDNDIKQLPYSRGISISLPPGVGGVSIVAQGWNP
jgi:hypothetical protein